MSLIIKSTLDLLNDEDGFADFLLSPPQVPNALGSTTTQ
jgi:hypothetical protein